MRWCASSLLWCAPCVGLVGKSLLMWDKGDWSWWILPLYPRVTVLQNSREFCSYQSSVLQGMPAPQSIVWIAPPGVVQMAELLPSVTLITAEKKKKDIVKRANAFFAKEIWIESLGKIPNQRWALRLATKYLNLSFLSCKINITNRWVVMGLKIYKHWYNNNSNGVSNPYTVSELPANWPWTPK